MSAPNKPCIDQPQAWTKMVARHRMMKVADQANMLDDAQHGSAHLAILAETIARVESLLEPAPAADGRPDAPPVPRNTANQLRRTEAEAALCRIDVMQRTGRWEAAGGSGVGRVSDPIGEQVAVTPAAPASKFHFPFADPASGTPNSPPLSRDDLIAEVKLRDDLLNRVYYLLDSCHGAAAGRPISTGLQADLWNALDAIEKVAQVVERTTAVAKPAIDGLGDGSNGPARLAGQQTRRTFFDAAKATLDGTRVRREAEIAAQRIAPIIASVRFASVPASSTAR